MLFGWGQKLIHDIKNIHFRGIILRNKLLNAAKFYRPKNEKNNQVQYVKFNCVFFIHFNHKSDKS